MRTSCERRRVGFTLVELLVVITIIALLAGMAVLIGNALFRSDKAQRAASTASAAFQIAKQTSLRDRVIYGVRLVPDGNGNFNGLEYVYQPPDYVGNTVENDFVDPMRLNAALGRDPRYLRFDQVNPARSIRAGLAPAPLPLVPPGPLVPPYAQPPVGWPVLPYDYIQTEHDSSPRLILAVEGMQAAHVAPTAPGVPNRVLRYNEIELLTGYTPTLDSPTSHFRVMRSPRSVPGEEIVRLPEGVIVDAGRSRMGVVPLNNFQFGPFVPPLANPFFPPPPNRPEFLFSPAQGVVGAAGRVGKIILWVRDTVDDPATSKNQVLLVIFTRTGTVTSYPVDTSGRVDPITGAVNPYSFTYDPRPTGL